MRLSGPVVVPNMRRGLGAMLLIGVSAWGCDEHVRLRNSPYEGVDVSTRPAAAEIADIVLGLPPWALTNNSLGYYASMFDLDVDPIDVDQVVLAHYERAAHKISAWSNGQIEAGFEFALRQALEDGQERLSMYAAVPYVLTRLIVQVPESVATSAVPFDAFSNLSLERSLELTTSPTNRRYATRWPIAFNAQGTLSGLARFPKVRGSGWGFVWRDFAWLSAAYSRRVTSVCENRCGNRSASASCQCDAACTTYDDCCVDVVLCEQVAEPE